jgi:predicted lipoprotein with Yx(FWY)xxD motif
MVIFEIIYFIKDELNGDKCGSSVINVWNLVFNVLL